MQHTCTRGSSQLTVTFTPAPLTIVIGPRTTIRALINLNTDHVDVINREDTSPITIPETPHDDLLPSLDQSHTMLQERPDHMHQPSEPLAEEDRAYIDHLWELHSHDTWYYDEDGHYHSGDTESPITR